MPKHVEKTMFTNIPECLFVLPVHPLPLQGLLDVFDFCNKLKTVFGSSMLNLTHKIGEFQKMKKQEVRIYKEFESATSQQLIFSKF